MEADVSIYTIDPRGLVATSGAPSRKGQGQDWYPSITRGPLDGTRYLAEQSGGFAVVNTNSLSAGFARIVRENSSYYLLGYYSTNSRADGKFRRNEVRLSRRGMQVVYRGGYLAPRASDAKKAASATNTGLTINEQLRELERNSAAGEHHGACGRLRSVSRCRRPIACGDRCRDAECHAQADRSRWPLSTDGRVVARPLR